MASAVGTAAAACFFLFKEKLFNEEGKGACH